MICFYVNNGKLCPMLQPGPDPRCMAYSVEGMRAFNRMGTCPHASITDCGRRNDFVRTGQQKQRRKK